MIPQMGMNTALEEFLHRQEKRGKETCEKCAYVIPTYEVDLKSLADIPTNKKALTKLLKVGFLQRNKLVSELRWYGIHTKT